MLVRAAIDDGMTSSKAIADKTTVHIFALRSLQPYAKRLSDKHLRTFLQWAVSVDRDLKTGVIRATDEAPQELAALVDQFILHAP